MHKSTAGSCPDLLPATSRTLLPLICCHWSQKAKASFVFGQLHRPEQILANHCSSFIDHKTRQWPVHGRWWHLELRNIVLAMQLLPHFDSQRCTHAWPRCSIRLNLDSVVAAKQVGQGCRCLPDGKTPVLLESSRRGPERWRCQVVVGPTPPSLLPYFRLRRLSLRHKEYTSQRDSRSPSLGMPGIERLKV